MFGAKRCSVTVRTPNSVLGGVAGGGSGMNWAFDGVHHSLVVGRQAKNIVSIVDVRLMLFLPPIVR